MFFFCFQFASKSLRISGPHYSPSNIYFSIYAKHMDSIFVFTGYVCVTNIMYLSILKPFEKNGFIHFDDEQYTHGPYFVRITITTLIMHVWIYLFY